MTVNGNLTLLLMSYPSHWICRWV